MIDAIRYSCFGLLIVLAVVTLINATREPEVFGMSMKTGAVIWIGLGVLAPITKAPITFIEWFGGGLIVIMGGAAILFNFAMLAASFDGGSQHHTRKPAIETVDGEVVDDSPALPEPRRPKVTHYRGKLVDPRWCDDCNHVTWQSSHNGEYTCDHKPTSRAPYERRRRSLK